MTPDPELENGQGRKLTDHFVDSGGRVPFGQAGNKLHLLANSEFVIGHIVSPRSPTRPRLIRERPTPGGCSLRATEAELTGKLRVV